MYGIKIIKSHGSEGTAQLTTQEKYITEQRCSILKAKFALGTFFRNVMFPLEYFIIITIE